METKYRNFIEKICKAGNVWALKTEEGYAMSDSTEYVTEEGEALPLFCFWSEKSLAEACRVEGWMDYCPVSISLEDFIEDWCIAVSDEESLIGIDFDRDMYGFEQEPLQLILDLETELKVLNKVLSFRKFSSLGELTAMIRKLM